MAALNDNDDIRKRPRAPTLYELIDKDGHLVGIFNMACDAAVVAKHRWPDQQQDPDRTGRGWDVQVVGCDR